MPELDVETFLSHFFGPGNDLSLHDLEASAPDLAAWLRDRIDDLRSDPTAAHVLPRRELGRTTWYGLAHSPRQLRALLDELNAFVGPTYSNLVLTSARLDGEDSVESAVHSFTAGHASAFEVISGGQRAVRSALDLRRIVTAAIPRREVRLARPLGRLLREFEMALTVGEEEASESLLRELEESGQLSTQNIVFLTIRRLAALRRWEDLLSLPGVSAVLSVRRPTNVTAALLTAVYLTELARYEAERDPVGAVSHFQDVVLPRYPALFKSRSGLLNAETLKTFMLFAVGAQPARLDLRDELLAVRDVSPEDREYLQAIAGLVAERAPVETADGLDIATAAALVGDFDRALSLAEAQPTSRERAELLIRCAVEIDSLAAMSSAVRAMEALSPEQRAQVLQSRWFRGPWEEILHRVGGSVVEAAPSAPPQSWSAWLERLVDEGPWPGAIGVVERGAMEWSYDAFASDTDELSKVVGLLNRSIGPHQARVVRDAVPYLLQFIDRGETPTPALRELYEDLLVLLLAGDEFGVADLQAVMGLVASLLDLGVSATKYREMVDDLRDLWDRVNAATHLDAGLEALDLLVMNPALDAAARDAFLQSLLASFIRWHRRVAVHQWDLLEDLADELGLRSAVMSARGGTTPQAGGEPSSSLRKALAGKKVGVYTLTEPAAGRVKAFLERHFDDLQVELNHDHVATEPLRNLARTADLLLVARRSAKHAATTFIEAERPSSRPTLYAIGKGSASMIRALYGFLGGPSDSPSMA